MQQADESDVGETKNGHVTRHGMAKEYLSSCRSDMIGLNLVEFREVNGKGCVGNI